MNTAVAPSPYAVGAHTWQVVVDSGTVGLKSMPVAAKALAATAIDVFTNADLREAARKDLEARTKGQPYKLLTPANRKPPVFSEEQGAASSNQR